MLADATFAQSRTEPPALAPPTPLPGVPASFPPAALEATPLPDVDAIVRAAKVTLDKPFLFIGVLSSARTYRRRVTVSQTWLQYVTHVPTTSVVVKFVLSHDEVEESVDKPEHVLFVKNAVTYSSILIKVFVIFEHAVELGARWTLKTDDDAYVNIPQAVQQLLKLCRTPACDAERSYVGLFIGGSPVMMDARHKWHNQGYIMHATVQHYLPYALGGGYVLSQDIIQVLVELHQAVGLVFTPIEDATVGMWLAGLNVTRVNWEGSMVTSGWTCCFRRSADRSVRNDILGRFSLLVDPCKPVRVHRPINMNSNEDLKAILSTRDPGLTRQATGDAATATATAETTLRSALSGATRHYVHNGVALRGLRAGSGADRTLLDALAGQDAVEQADAHSVETIQARRERAATIVREQEAPPVATGTGTSHGAWPWDGVWRAPPMIMHKVANPLHLHYLHWRLQHCGIPRSQLLTVPAVASAQQYVTAAAPMVAASNARPSGFGAVQS